MSNIKSLTIKLFVKGMSIDKTTEELCSEIINYLTENNLITIGINNKIKFYNCNSNRTHTLTEKILEGYDKGVFLFLALNNLKLLEKTYIDYLILTYSTFNYQKNYKHLHIKKHLLPHINENIKDIYINPSSNNTLFHYACQNGHCDIIKIIFKKFASYEDANQENNDGKTPYNLTRDNFGDNHPVMKLLNNFKWIESDKTKIRNLTQKIETLKRKYDNLQNTQKTQEKKVKITHVNNNQQQIFNNKL